MPNFEQELDDFLIEEFGVFANAQVLWAGEDIPREELRYPHILLKWNSRMPNPLSLMPPFPTDRRRIPFDADRWGDDELQVPYDIEYHYDDSLEATLSVTVVGLSEQQMQVKQLAEKLTWYLKVNDATFDAFQATCFSLAAAQNRTAALEGQVEVQWGFDSRWRLTENLNVIERTLERVKGTLTIKHDDSQDERVEPFDVKSKHYPVAKE